MIGTLPRQAGLINCAYNVSTYLNNNLYNLHNHCIAFLMLSLM